MSTVWSQDQSTFIPGSNVMQTETLPSGIYHYKLALDKWVLERTADNFQFPYKVYGYQDDVIGRILHYWAETNTNLGVLLNGAKGSGKTLAAQVVANRMIKDGCPVLVVNNPVPLGEILSTVQQDLMVIFDEFEKTHYEEQQQDLLSAIDGMVRSEHRRMFMFTTNQKNLNENFIDRPSRIRYIWDFDRLSERVLNQMMDDILDKKLWDMRPMVLEYLSTRKVLTVDIAMATICEVNIFGEDPEMFARILNVSEMTPTDFRAEVLNPDGTVNNTWTGDLGFDRAFMDEIAKNLSYSVKDSDTTLDNREFIVLDSSGGIKRIKFCKRTPGSPNEWTCRIAPRESSTWASDLDFRMMGFGTPFLDEEPEDWTVPEWAIKKSDGLPLTEQESKQCDAWRLSRTVYGSRQPIEFLVRFKRNFGEIQR